MQNAVTPNGTTPVFTRGAFLCGQHIEQTHLSVYFHVTNTIHFCDFVNSEFIVSLPRTQFYASRTYIARIFLANVG